MSGYHKARSRIAKEQFGRMARQAMVGCYELSDGSHYVLCQRCEGDGWESRVWPVTACPECGGDGTVRVGPPLEPRFVKTADLPPGVRPKGWAFCVACYGNLTTDEHQTTCASGEVCKECDGSGRVWVLR